MHESSSLLDIPRSVLRSRLIFDQVKPISFHIAEKLCRKNLEENVNIQLITVFCWHDGIADSCLFSANSFLANSSPQGFLPFNEEKGQLKLDFLVFLPGDSAIK